MGTPIGNLSDASPRVKETLAAADIILCEDTRVTSKLLSALTFTCHCSAVIKILLNHKLNQRLRGFALSACCICVRCRHAGYLRSGQHLVDAALLEGLATEVIQVLLR